MSSLSDQCNHIPLKFVSGGAGEDRLEHREKFLSSRQRAGPLGGSVCHCSRLPELTTIPRHEQEEVEEQELYEEERLHFASKNPTHTPTLPAGYFSIVGELYSQRSKLPLQDHHL